MLGFRVWDNIKKEMICPDDYDNNFYIDPFCELYHDGFGDCTRCDDRYLPMQSTGLKDVDGKEIFQGDILHIQYRLNPDGSNYLYLTREINFFIVGNVTSFLRWLGSMEPIELMQVKGNSFENPELLEKLKC